jgi:hypothetical protein
VSADAQRLSILSPLAFFHAATWRALTASSSPSSRSEYLHPPTGQCERWKRCAGKSKAAHFRRQQKKMDTWISLSTMVSVPSSLVRMRLGAVGVCGQHSHDAHACPRGRRVADRLGLARMGRTRCSAGRSLATMASAYAPAFSCGSLRPAQRTDDTIEYVRTAPWAPMRRSVSVVPGNLVAAGGLVKHFGTLLGDLVVGETDPVHARAHPMSRWRRLMGPQRRGQRPTR